MVSISVPSRSNRMAGQSHETECYWPKAVSGQRASLARQLDSEAARVVNAAANSIQQAGVARLSGTRTISAFTRDGQAGADADRR